VTVLVVAVLVVAVLVVAAQGWYGRLLITAPS
jgi:hypothetical protein